MNLWRQYSSQALIGLDQSPSIVPIAETSPLEAMLFQARSNAPSPQESFLDELGILANWRRCGRKAIEVGTLPDAPPHEDRQTCSSEARSCLLEILDTAYSVHFLIEWLHLADRSGTLIPPELLPSLLSRSTRQPELIELVRKTGGKRADLLAKQNPKWGALVQGDLKEIWEEGQPAERLAALRSLAENRREEALTLVTESWKSEAASFRVKVIQLIGQNPNTDGEAFLESALSDKSQEVRANATLALARFHQSTVAINWAEVAKQILEYKPSGLLSKGSFDFGLPNDSMLSDLRIETKPITKSARIGEKAATLSVLIAATPVSVWLEQTKFQPAKLIGLAARSDHALAILSGLAVSASLSANVEFVKELFNQPKPFDLLIDNQSLLAQLPPDSAQRILSDLIASGQLYPYPVKSGRSVNANTLPFPWSGELTISVLGCFSKLVRSEETYWGSKDLLTSFAPFLETETAIRAITAWKPSSVWSDAATLLIDQLRFRERIANSFSANANS